MTSCSPQGQAVSRLKSLLQGVLWGVLPVVLGVSLAATAQAAGSRVGLGKTLSGEAAVAVPERLQGGEVRVFVELEGQAAVKPLASMLGGSKLSGASAPVRAAALAARDVQISRNRQAQAQFSAQLSASGVAYTEMFRVQQVMNGIAMTIDRSQRARIEKMAGVKRVYDMQPEVPTSNQSVAFIGSTDVWAGTGSIPSADGTGITIGIIDTGIDFLHAHFGGTGAAADYAALDTTATAGVFPTAKVVGGYDFAGNAYTGSNTPTPDANPMDCNGHGSHVAGSAAGYGVTAAGATYTGGYASVPTTLRIQPGVAPNASLVAYRVFGCSGTTNLTVQAIEQAVTDGVDVINMSLGTAAGGLSDLSSVAAENAAAAGVIVVTSAGNSGDTYMVTGSPGVAKRVISVANTTDDGEGVGRVRITAGSLNGQIYEAGVAAFGPQVPFAPGAVSNELVMAQPALACSALTNAAAVAGKIAVIDRGTCAFTIKVKAAQDAGAVGVLILSTVDVVADMGGSDATITIPSLIVRLSNGNTIRTTMGAETLTADLYRAAASDLVNSSSSRGPANAFPYSLKPNLSAPGTNIVSAQTGYTSGGIVADSQPLTLSGTSMASPHVAGFMALLRQLHPSWTVEELKALAMNGATHDLWTGVGATGSRYGAGRVGAGRVDVAATAELEVIAFNDDGEGTVALSFPGEIANATTTVDRTFTLRNKGASAATLNLSIDDVVTVPGVSFSVVSANPVTVAAGASQTVTIRMTGQRDLINHAREATVANTTVVSGNTTQLRYWLTEASSYVAMTDGGVNTLRLPLYVAPVAASQMTAGAVINTGNATSGTGAVTLSGTPLCTGTYVAGPPASCTATPPFDTVSLVTLLELQADLPRDVGIPAERNFRRIGANYDSANGVINIGLQTWGQWAQPMYYDIDAEVVIVDADDNPMFTLYPSFLRDPNNYPTNVYRLGVYNNTANTTATAHLSAMTPTGFDTRMFQSDVLLYSVAPSTIGLTASSVLRYYVESYDSSGLLEVQGPFELNLAAQGVNFHDSWLTNDLPGVQYTVDWNLAALAANRSLGGMAVHHHNAAGATVEVLRLSNSLVANGGGMQSQQVGQLYGAPLVATVYGAGGAPASGVSVTFTLPASGASGTFVAPCNGLHACTVTTNASGVATSPAFRANGVAGAFTATAGVAGYSTPTTYTLNNLVGAASAIAVSGGSAQSAAVGAAFANPLVALVTDGFGNPVSGVTVQFTLPASGASATFAGGVLTFSATSAADGTATSSALTAGAIAGTYNATASAAGAGSASFSLTNLAGAAAGVAIFGGDAQSAPAGSTFVTPLRVRVVDAGGNPVAGQTVVFTIVPGGTGAAGTFAGGLTSVSAVSDASGIATPGSLVADAIEGAFTVTAAAGNIGTVTFNLVVTAALPDAIPVPAMGAWALSLLALLIGGLGVITRARVRRSSLG